MPKFNKDWTVQPHGPLEALDEGLLTVAGEIVMPLGRFPRRMTVVGLNRGRVAIWSPVPLREPEMARIEALGEVTFLIVPGVGHRLDIQAWRARYPKARVVCAPGARKAVEEVVQVDEVGDVFRDPAVRMEAAPGVGEMEAILWVRREGATLVVNDILANVRHPHGLGAHIMARLLGFGVDHPRMPKVGKKMFVKDARALAAGFRAWAAEPDLVRVVVSHGDILTEDVRGVLERAASEIEA
jgi:hypothetical protein